jgi:hypothetical protein
MTKNKYENIKFINKDTFRYIMYNIKDVVQDILHMLMTQTFTVCSCKAGPIATLIIYFTLEAEKNYKANIWITKCEQGWNQ